MIKQVIYILLFFSAAALQAQTLELVTDRDEMMIGEQAIVTLKAEINSDETYVWPIIEESLGLFEIIEQDELIIKKEKGQLLLSQKLVVTSFDSGFFDIKPIALALEKDTLFTEPSFILVTFPDFSEQQEMFDIKEPVQAPFEWPQWLTWLLVAIVAAVLLWKFWLSKLTKKEEVIEEEKDLRNSYEKLGDSLRSIRKHQLWTSVSDKEFYISLTHVMRAFLENEYGISALERTTHEIRPEIQALQWNHSFKEQLLQLLTEADMVKFAKAMSNEAQKLAYFDQMFAIYEHLEREDKWRQFELKNQANDKV